VNWDEAVDVLRAWRGHPVVLVPILEPGVSLRPFTGLLELDDGDERVIRVRVPTQPPDPRLQSPDGATVALPKATFIEAGWVPGQEERGLSVVQGALRVDVFLDGED
jgi:hypothetical protein